MAGLFSDFQPNNLQDVLQKQAQTASEQTSDQYNQARRRLVSQQAAGGRLMSGVSSYPLTDLDTGQAQALSGIQGNLESSLAGIPSEDWLNQKNFQRSYDLANLIGRLNKPSTLEEVLGGIGAVGPTAALGAALL